MASKGALVIALLALAVGGAAVWYSRRWKVHDVFIRYETGFETTGKLYSIYAETDDSWILANGWYDDINATQFTLTKLEFKTWIKEFPIKKIDPNTPHVL